MKNKIWFDDIDAALGITESDFKIFEEMRKN